MKSLIVPIIIVVGLITTFVIIDRKENYRHNDNQNIQTMSSELNRKNASTIVQNAKNGAEPKTMPEAKPTDKPLAEIKPIAEEWSFDETNTTDNETKAKIKSIAKTTSETENKTTAETKQDTKEKPAVEKDNIPPLAGTKTVRATDSATVAPVAVPVITPDEAERTNALAMEYFIPIENRQKHIKKGFKLLVNEKFTKMRSITLTTKQELSLRDKGYDLNEFRKRSIPYGLKIDIDNLPSGVSFRKEKEGLKLNTGEGNIQFQANKFDSMRSSFFIEIAVRNESKENDCEIELGVQGSGAFKNGYSLIKKESLKPGQETILQWEIGVYDRYLDIMPTFSLKGIATIKEFDVYRLDHDEFTIVEGLIADRSSLPEPETTDYPDCRFTAHFIGNSIASGSPCNKELALSVDGFIDKKVLPSNDLKKNDKIKCAIVRFDSVPEELSGTQEADNLSLYELDCYLLTSYRKINVYTDYSETNSGFSFKDEDSTQKEYVSVFSRKINPALSDETIKAQKESIETDLKKIEELLQPFSDEKKQEINAEFAKAWEQEKSKDQEGKNRIGDIVWRDMDNSFYALPESYKIIEDYPKISQDNLNALVAFKDFLDSNGVQLIVSLVPNFYDIAARVINKDFSSLPDFRTASTIKQLLEHNIEAIYGSDAIIANYNKFENAFFYPADRHPFDLPQDILSDILCKKISRYSFTRQYNFEDFQSIKSPVINTSITYNNRTYPQNCDIGKHQVGELYLFNQILLHGQEIQNDLNSPVLVFGNSFSNTPTPYAISKYLTMKSGIGIYHYSISGGGILTTGIQRIFNNPERFLKNRKVLILHIGTIHMLANITIPNIRDLDSEFIMLNSKKQIDSIQVSGNDSVIPDFASHLSNPSIFKLDDNGSCTIVNSLQEISKPLAAQTHSDKSNDIVLVINYCCDAYDKMELHSGDSVSALSGCNSNYIWMKQMMTVSTEENNISIKVSGKPNSVIAIGSILVYH